MNKGQSTLQRNRVNAQASTGPTSLLGKTISRRNSTTHGLTANPASGTIEDGREFKRLLKAIRHELLPESVVEDLIVQRIAVAAWRLYRCSLADSAVWDTAVHATPPARVEVHEYIERIMHYWRAELVENLDDPEAAYRIANKLPPARHHVRRGLGALDDLRRDTLMCHGSAIMAMVAMIEELMISLGESRRSFSCFEAERLAWLLGEDARRLERVEDDVRFPGEYIRGTEIDRLILEAAKRDPSQPIPKAMLREVDRRLSTLRAQARTCENPYTDEAWQQRWKQAPFAAESVLERLLRYETHAERSLHKNLEALARLRGETVQTIFARIRRRTNDGTELELQGKRTQTISGAPRRGRRSRAV